MKMTLLPTRACLITYIYSVLIRQHTNKVIKLSQVGVLTLLMKVHLQNEDYCRQQNALTPACFRFIQCGTSQRKYFLNFSQLKSHSPKRVYDPRRTQGNLCFRPNGLLVFKRIGLLLRSARHTGPPNIYFFCCGVLSCGQAHGLN